MKTLEKLLSGLGKATLAKWAHVSSTRTPQI